MQKDAFQPFPIRTSQLRQSYAEDPQLLDRQAEVTQSEKTLSLTA